MPPLTDGCARVHQIWEIDPDLEGPEFPGACLPPSPPAALVASQLVRATGASLREIFKQWEPFMQNDAEEPGAGQQGGKGEPRTLSLSPRRVLLPRCHPDAGRFEKIQTGGEQEARAAPQKAPKGGRQAPQRRHAGGALSPQRGARRGLAVSRGVRVRYTWLGLS